MGRDIAPDRRHVLALGEPVAEPAAVEEVVQSGRAHLPDRDRAGVAGAHAQREPGSSQGRQDVAGTRQQIVGAVPLLGGARPVQLLDHVRDDRSEVVRRPPAAARPRGRARAWIVPASVKPARLTPR